MALTYHLRSHRSRGDFDLLDADGQPLATLTYPRWYSYSAQLEVADRQFTLKKSGFWRQAFDLWEGEQRRGIVRIDWRGRMTIELGEDEALHQFRMRRRGCIKPYFELQDTEEHLLAELRPRFRWRTLNYDTDIHWQRHEGHAFSRHLLLALAGYLANVARRQQAAAAAG